MKTFIDTATQQVWEFEDSVIDIFTYQSTPQTLIPYVRPEKTASELLTEARLDKSTLIRQSYEVAANSYASALGFIWQGGFDSAIKLDAAMRLSQAAGLTTVTFYDADNIGHTLSMSDALVVVIAVSMAFQISLAKKQGLLKAIETATLENVDTISW